MGRDMEDGEVSPSRDDRRRNGSPDRRRRDRSRSRDRDRSKKSYEGVSYKDLDRYSDRYDDRRYDRDRYDDRRGYRDRDRGRGGGGLSRDDLRRERDRDDRRDRDRDRDRRRSRSRSKDRKDRDRDREERKEEKEEKKSHDWKAALAADEEDEPYTFEEEESEDALKKKREAILAKFKNRSASPAVPTPPAEAPKAEPAPAKVAKDDDTDKKAAPAAEEKKSAASAAAPAAPQEQASAMEVEGTTEGENGEKGGDGGDDMFSDSPLKPVASAVGELEPMADDKSGLEEDTLDRRQGVTNADNWDDAEGYFRTRPGELIISRYLVNRDIGNGVYSTVISAMDQTEQREVAIKVVRSNETMYNAGRKEIEVLKKLGNEDPEGKKHICKLLSHFEYKNHLCMVFIPQEMNLRKLLKTYGREVGITLNAIRAYTRQCLLGLLHMIKCQVVHGDIKLDNILISKDLKNVAICDFGTADWTHECTITPYMVSRYYRPPEICLGLRYGHPMDLWSVGVCLYELYTGKFMFTGRNNNDMLKQFMDYKGMPSKKMLKKAQFFDQHFEDDGQKIMFKYLTKDIVTKQEIIQKMTFDKPSKNIYDQLRKVRADGDDPKKVKEFADLLEKIFILDQEKRISVTEALKHPFLH